MILTGPEIEKRVREGTIEITPFDPARVQAASVDLTLGANVFTYEATHGGVLDPFAENPGRHQVIGGSSRDGAGGAEFVIYPRNLYLMHTIERVWSAKCVPVLDGKSSLGRLGVRIHQTAGYGDPGFNGQYTLEVTCELPIRLRVGMPIAQIRFHETAGFVRRYAGGYSGAGASGAVPARPLK